MLIPAEFTASEIDQVRKFITRNVFDTSRIVKGSIKGDPCITYEDVAGLLGYEIGPYPGPYNVGLLARKVTELDFPVSGAMLSALIIKKDSLAPGPGFYDLAREMKLYYGQDEMDELAFWSLQMTKIVETYGRKR